LSEAAYVTFDQVQKSYDGKTLVVEDLDLHIREGEFLTMLGPSGSGKTTCLMMLAGFETATHGEICIGGKAINRIPPHKRGIGMVFQSSSLFPRMTVRENVEYALRPHVDTASERTDRAKEYLELVKMSEKAKSLPESLSGGEARRAELARALSYEPDVMLLDEPLTGLDRSLRDELRGEIKRIHDQTDVTTVLVTHDQKEAISVSDRIVVLNDGRKEQEGCPETLYRHPKTCFVAEFVGDSTRFEGVVEKNGDVRLEAGATVRVNGRGEGKEGEEASVYVRPENVEILNGDRSHKNVFSGEVIEVTEMGGHAEARVRTPAGEVLSKVEGFSGVCEGEEVFVGFEDSDAIVVADGVR
jgi:putative spermidine/putrescine transport system ATP-binding protein